MRRPLEPSVHRLRLPVGSHRGVINMAGRYQGFHSLNTGNIEIFWRADGWCWWSRTPGCPSVSAPVIRAYVDCICSLTQYRHEPSGKQLSVVAGTRNHRDRHSIVIAI